MMEEGSVRVSGCQSIKKKQRINKKLKGKKEMLLQKEIIKILREKSPYLKKNFSVERIGIFGSLAGGRFNKNSDIDILVKFKQPIGLKFIEFAEYMEKLLDRKVDIITYEGMRAIRVKRVVRSIKKGLLYV